MVYKVYAPNVHLFTYHLHNQEQNTHKDLIFSRSEKSDLLWRKCENILQLFGFSKTLEIQDEEGRYKVDLLKGKTAANVTLKVSGTINFNQSSVKVSAVVYPFRLHDTYGLALNLERDEQDKPIEPLDSAFLAYLNPEGCFLPQHIKSSLGQTLLLTICNTTEWYSKSHHQNLRELADECLEAFLPESFPHPSFNQTGELFGNSIFEYGHPTLPDYCHILVWIFSKDEERSINQKLTKVYSNLIDLFCYRNKIITAYQQSQILHEYIKIEYQNNEKYLLEINSYSPNNSLRDSDLNSFRTQLKEIPLRNYNYSQCIIDLENYRQTIEVNICNYQRELKNIQSQFPEENFAFLEAFIEGDCRLYQEQVQSDLGYLKHGVDLLDNAIRVISTRLEIEQTELDRKQADADKVFRQSLEAIGIGIGAGAIVASSSGLITQPWVMPWQKEASWWPPHPFFSAIALSVVAGLFGWYVIKKCIEHSK